MPKNTVNDRGAPEGQDPAIILENLLPYLANRLVNRLNRRLKSDLRPYGLTIANWRILAILVVTEAVTMNQIAEWAMIEQPTASRMIDRMEAQGLLVRRKDENDGRIRSISLTPDGRDVYFQVQAHAVAHTEVAFADFTDRECEQFRSMIYRIEDNLAQDGTSA